MIYFKASFKGLIFVFLVNYAFQLRDQSTVRPLCSKNLDLTKSNLWVHDVEAASTSFPVQSQISFFHGFTCTKLPNKKFDPDKLDFHHSQWSFNLTSNSQLSLANLTRNKKMAYVPSKDKRLGGCNCGLVLQPLLYMLFQSSYVS